MKFSEFFDGGSDRDLAECIKVATKITLDDASRGDMRGLLFEYARMRPIRAQAPSRASRGAFISFFTAHIHPMPAIAAILIVVISGSTVTAAETALPGDIFYPVKIHVTEEVRAVLATNSKARADWAVERAERRLEEAAVLSLSGRLDDATRAEIDTNLEAHVRHAAEDRARLESENELSEASEIEKDIGAVRIARANILDGARRNPRIAAKAAAPAEASDAALTSMQMKAAPAATERAQQEKITPDGPETVARGQRTAAKVRIEATRKFLKARNSLTDEERGRAQERLEAATEAFASGDENNARGNTEGAFSNFNSALEAATDIETLISGQPSVLGASSEGARNERKNRVEQKNTDIGGSNDTTPKEDGKDSSGSGD
ncbi:MAG: DUF5667 domain-containing protein [Patescibacteria group bacterium]